MAEVKLNPQILITASNELKDLLETIEHPSEQIKTALAKNEITPYLLKEIRSKLNSEDKKKLFYALERSQMKLPSPEYPDRNPELEARCQKLRREQEEKEYRRLTKNVRNQLTVDDAPISVQMKELNAILISLVQFVVSVGCAFTFGFMAPYLFYGNESVGVRILSGTVIGIIVGIADLYFVIRETLHNEGFVVKKIE